MRPSSTLFEAVFARAPVGIAVVDLEGRFVSVNPAFCAFVHEDAESLLGTAHTTLLAPESRRRNLIEGRRLLSGESDHFDLIERVKRGDGSSAWSQSRVVVERDVSGEPLHFIAVVTDATEVTEALAAVVLSEERYRTLVENLPETVVFIFDLELRLLVAAGPAWTAAGRYGNDAIGRRAEEVVDPDDRYLVLPLLAAAARGQSGSVEYYSQARSSWFLFDVRPMPESSRIIATARDITEIRKSELASREAKIEHLAAAEASPIGIARADVDGNLIRVNRAMLELFAVSREVLLGERIDSRASEATSMKVANWLEQARHGAPDPLEIDDVFLLGGGTHRWVSFNISAIRGLDGIPRQLVVHYVNIDEHVRRRQALEDAEARAREIAELSPDGVVVVDEEGRFAFANAAAARMLGYQSEELIGMEKARLRSPGHERAACARWKAVFSGEVVSASRESLLHRDGHDVPVEISSAPIQRDGSPAILSVVRDISGRLTRASQLQAAQERIRLSFDQASIGHALADLAGVWFEVNPALCSILGYSRAELLGQGLGSLARSGDERASQETLAELVAEVRGSASFEQRFVKGDGTTMWASVNVGLARDGAGTPSYLVIQIEDITERHRRGEELQSLSEELAEMNIRLTATAATAEANEARYRALVEHLPDTVTFVYDANRKLVMVSGFGVHTEGFDASQLLGKTPDELVHKADATLINGYLEVALRGESVSQEIYIHTTETENLIDVVPLTTADGQPPSEVLVVARDIHLIKAREREIAAAEVRWRTAFDKAPVAMLEVDTQGHVVLANEAAARLLELPLDELTGSSVVDLFPEVGGEAIDSSLTMEFISGERTDLRTDREIVTAGGNRSRVTLIGSRLPSADDAPGRALFYLVDVTAQYRERKEIEAAHDRFSALIEHSSDAIIVADSTGSILYASPGFKVLTGIDVDGWEDLNVLDLVHPADRAELRDEIQNLIVTEGKILNFDCRVQAGEGLWHYAEVTVSNRVHDPAVGGIVVNARDITERVEAAERLAHQALHDALTGLPNRSLLLDMLNRALARSERSSLPCAALFLDLDGFKRINDTLGHATGDDLLRAVAERLESAVRPGDSVARLGGDEFVVIAEGIEQVDAAISIAERIRISLAEPIRLLSRSVTISCSIGIAVSNGDGAEVLLEEADMALYQAKAAGRNRWEIYNESMRLRAREQLDTEDLIRGAINYDRLLVHYQPIVDFADEVVRGHEALARIRHIDGTISYPGSFVAVAEDNGLIIPLGASILRMACEQQFAWRDRTNLRYVSVNLSAPELSSELFVPRLKETLASAGLAPSQLCVELTEAALIDAGSVAQQNINQISELGTHIALDDFGTGWSSLAYLRRFPVTIVKIDRSFISNIDGEDGNEVVRAIIGLGEALGLETVAKGVETKRQAEILREMGCSYGQGTHFGTPTTAPRVHHS